MFKTNSRHFEGVSEKKFILPDQNKEQEYKLEKQTIFFYDFVHFFFQKMDLLTRFLSALGFHGNKLL